MHYCCSLEKQITKAIFNKIDHLSGSLWSFDMLFDFSTNAMAQQHTRTLYINVIICRYWLFVMVLNTSNLFFFNWWSLYSVLINTNTDYYNYHTDVKLEFPQVIHNLCAYYKYIEYGLFGTSILHLTAITINRYISICHRGFYSKIYCSRNVYIMICIMWLSSFGFVLLPLFGIWGQIGK